MTDTIPPVDQTDSIETLWITRFSDTFKIVHTVIDAMNCILGPSFGSQEHGC